MKFKAMTPAHRPFSVLGEPRKDLIEIPSYVVAYGDHCAINERYPRTLAESIELHKEHQFAEYTRLELYKAIIDRIVSAIEAVFPTRFDVYRTAIITFRRLLLYWIYVLLKHTRLSLVTILTGTNKKSGHLISAPYKEVAEIRRLLLVYKISDQAWSAAIAAALSAWTRAYSSASATTRLENSRRPVPAGIKWPQITFSFIPSK